MSRHLVKLGTASVAALALVATTAPAMADPSTTPTRSNSSTYRTYAAVGSDTTQDVWNALTNTTATNAGGPVTQVASWNAFGGVDDDADGSTTDIVTKFGGNEFTRPTGSGAGVRALSAVHDPEYTSHLYGGAVLDHNDVDFARSSSGPAAGTGLSYLPFARDAVSVAYNPTTGLTGVNLDTAQLTELYSGNDGDDADGVTFSGGLPRLNGVPVQPKLPQGSSGTRAFFLGAIGVTATTLATYVEPPASTLPENDGTAIPNDGDLIPFSAAQWIAQNNGAATNTTAGLELASIGGSAPTTGTAPALAPGALYGNLNAAPATGVGAFARDTYNVIPTAFLSAATGTPQQALVAKLTGTTPTSLGSANARNIITQYGFGALGYYGNSAFFRDGAFQH